MEEKEPFLLMNLPNDVISKILVKSHLSDLVQTRSSCRSLRRLLFDRTFQEAYNVAHHGTIMRFTHIRTLPRDSPDYNLGLVLVEDEDGRPFEYLRIRGILQQRNVALADNVMLHLVGVWGMVLVFFVRDPGMLLLINLWDGSVRRLQLHDMSPINTDGVRRRTRVVYGLSGEYVVLYVDVDIDSTVAVYRNLSRDEVNPRDVCILVDHLEGLERIARLVVPFYSPPVRIVVSYRQGLPVFAMGPRILGHPHDLPIPPGLVPDVVLLDSIDGYMVILDLVYNRDEFTNGFTRLCLYELSEDLSEWTLISTLPPPMLPLGMYRFIPRNSQVQALNYRMQVNIALSVAMGVGRDYKYILFRYDVAMQTWTVEESEVMLNAISTSPTYFSENGIQEH